MLEVCYHCFAYYIMIMILDNPKTDGCINVRKSRIFEPCSLFIINSGIIISMGWGQLQDPVENFINAIFKCSLCLCRRPEKNPLRAGENLPQ